VLPHLTATAPWQTLLPSSAVAQSAQLDVLGDGHVRYVGNKIKKDVYTIKAFTNQVGLTAFRIDVFADPAFPNHGPGLSDNGNFVLGDLRIVAKPHDATVTAKPIAITLKPGAATFQQQGYPLDAVLDNSPESGWGVDPQEGKDHSVTFLIAGNPIGFPGGTDLVFTLTWDYFGAGNVRLSFAAPAASTAPAPAIAPTTGIPGNAQTHAPPALSDAVESQSLREIQAMLMRSGGHLPASERNVSLQWFSAFDSTAAALEEAVRAHERKRIPNETFAVYTTKSGGQDVYLLQRGEVDKKEVKSDPGFLEVLENGKPSLWLKPGDADPRLGLARWMTDVDAGAGRLLARVAVNRVWKNLFGTGLVSTPNDFGLQGETPSYPILLDYLAGELIHYGWHIKPLVREIMLTAVYQQGAQDNDRYRTRDPEDKLWWYRPAMRLEAEAIRDSLISIAGRLDRSMYGPAIEDFTIPRRSVYLRVRRSELFPFLTLFDAPEPTLSNGDRGITTQPTQALAMMNSDLVRQTADAVRTQVATPGVSPHDAIVKAYHLILSRAPTDREVTRLVAFFQRQKTMISGKKSANAVDDEAMSITCQILLCLNEFVYID
jgi:hypothetical protein